MTMTRIVTLKETLQSSVFPSHILGIVEIDNVQVNPQQPTIFTCYLTEDLQADDTNVQLFKFTNGISVASSIPSRPGPLTNTRVFDVANVMPGDQYLCSLTEENNVVKLVESAKTYGETVIINNLNS